MNTEFVKTEIESLESFLKNQAERFFQMESDEEKNEFKADPVLKNLVSNIHHDLSKIVNQIKSQSLNRIELFTHPPAEKKAEAPETPEDKKEMFSTEAKETPEKFSVPMMPPNPNQPTTFLDMNKSQKIAHFLNGKLKDLDGTGEEWNDVKDYLKGEIEKHSIDSPEVISPNTENESGKEKKKKAPVKKAAKKAAKKKAAKKK